jgi:hypothetical protein
MDTIDDVYCLCRMMRKALRKLRYKCRRHNADYYTDSAIPDKETRNTPIKIGHCYIQTLNFFQLVYSEIQVRRHRRTEF